MKKFVSMFAFMAALVLGAFTFASCGDDDDEVTPSPSENQGSYSKLYAHVNITHDKKTNPFLTNEEAEKKVQENLISLIKQELSKIDGVKEENGSYYYDDKKQAAVYSAIKSAMDKLESTMQNQQLYLDGKIQCDVKAGPDNEEIWAKEFNYTNPANHITDNGINYCVISDSEVGVVENDSELGKSKYAGEIVIPETIESNGKKYTVTTIAPKVFYGSAITGISLPKTLTTLYYQCFGFARELKSITLPGALKNFKQSAEGRLEIFNRCTALEEVVLEEGMTTMYKDMFYNLDTLQRVVLPSTITEIPNSCFGQCRNLTDLTVNGTITNVSAYAFSNSGISDLSVFKFKNATLGEDAFGSCQNITEAIIPNGVVTIEGKCFSTCHSLVSVTIPASVTSMGLTVFRDDEKLKEIHMKGDKPATLKEQVIGQTYDTFSILDFAAQGLTIYVPAASVDAYKQAPVWSKYADYIKGE